MNSSILIPSLLHHSVRPLISPCAINHALNPRNTPARKRIPATRTAHADPTHTNITTYARARAHQVPDIRIVLLARGTLEVGNVDAGDGQVGRELVAQRDVFLAIALRYFDCVVDV